MVSKQNVSEQLKNIGAKVGFLGHNESEELSKILVEGESIKQCLVGLYHDAVSLLCVTDRRVVVVDKRPLFLNIEDIRYEMMSEVDFGGRLINSSLSIHTFGKSFLFRSWQHTKLRSAYGYVQEMIMETRTKQIRLPMGAAESKTPLLWRKQVSKFYSA